MTYSLRMPVLLVLAIFICHGSLYSAIENTNEHSGNILFFGDSLTAGYGIERNLAYPHLISKKVESENLPYKVVASGLSGETSAGGLRRIDWVMRQPIAILVLALGANDGLRGLDLATTESNLQAIIDKAKERNQNLKIVIVGMQIPPNLGQDYARQFKQMYPRLAEKNDAILIPFLLEGVAGDKNLNLSDGFHPNPEGHRIIAETVWIYLEPQLRNGG